MRVSFLVTVALAILFGLQALKAPTHVSAPDPQTIATQIHASQKRLPLNSGCIQPRSHHQHSAQHTTASHAPLQDNERKEERPTESCTAHNSFKCDAQQGAPVVTASRNEPTFSRVLAWISFHSVLSPPA